MQKQVFLGLGTNLGKREDFLANAFKKIQKNPYFSQVQISSVYETKSVGGEGPDYLNAVAGFKTAWDVTALHQWMMEMEKKAGRLRIGFNAPRTLDIDLLFYGNDLIETPHLTVPHPRLHIRAFVLIPLCEIASQWIHPLLELDMQTLLDSLSLAEKQDVLRMDIALGAGTK